MKMCESFEKWFPEGDLDSVYDVDNIELNCGVKVYLIPDGLRKEALKGQKLLLHWNNFLCVQVSDESYREDCWVSGRENAWTFYVSSDSSYLRAYREKSCLFPDYARHFLISGTNTIIDVLASEFPNVALTIESIPEGCSQSTRLATGTGGTPFFNPAGKRAVPAFEDCPTKEEFANQNYRMDTSL